MEPAPGNDGATIRYEWSGGYDREASLGQTLALAARAAAGPTVLFALAEHEPAFDAVGREHAQALPRLGKGVLEVPQVLGHVTLRHGCLA